MAGIEPLIAEEWKQRAEAAEAREREKDILIEKLRGGLQRSNKTCERRGKWLQEKDARIAELEGALQKVKHPGLSMPEVIEIIDAALSAPPQTHQLERAVVEAAMTWRKFGALPADIQKPLDKLAKAREKADD